MLMTLVLALFRADEISRKLACVPKRADAEQGYYDPIAIPVTS
jgi:hypothetical protein